jgi:hypothetical protein
MRLSKTQQHSKYRSGQRNAKTIFIVTSLFILLVIPIASNLGSSSAQIATVSTGPDFNFGAAGDWGTNTNTKETANIMKSKGVELALGLGDYAYLTGSTAVKNWWDNYMTPLHGKFKGTLGNHDTTDFYTYLSKFGQSNWVFSFNFRDVHFLSISTERDYTAGSSQYNAVKNDLAKASTNPDIQWIIVFFHKPMYTSPSRHSPLPTLISTYHPLFDRYGVDLVFQGHNHNYQRSYPILFNNNDPLNPTITSKSSTSYFNPKGQIYLVVGTGGVSSYSFLGKSPYIVKQFASTFGFLNVDVVNNGMTLRGTFYSNDGTVKDQFSITRS